jgi:hypothetical protein
MNLTIPDIILQKTTNFRELQKSRRPVKTCDNISFSDKEKITATSLWRMILEEDFLSMAEKYLPYTYLTE